MQLKTTALVLPTHLEFNGCSTAHPQQAKINHSYFFNYLHWTVWIACITILCIRTCGVSQYK